MRMPTSRWTPTAARPSTGAWPVPPSPSWSVPTAPSSTSTSARLLPTSSSARSWAGCRSPFDERGTDTPRARPWAVPAWPAGTAVGPGPRLRRRGDGTAAVRIARAGSALPCPGCRAALRDVPEPVPGRLQRRHRQRPAPRSVRADAGRQERHRDQGLPDRALRRVRAVPAAGSPAHLAAVVRAAAGAAGRRHHRGGDRPPSPAGVRTAATRRGGGLVTTAFALTALLLVLVALAFVLPPLLRQPPAHAGDHQARLQALEAARATGILSQAEYEAKRAALAADGATGDAAATPPAPSRRSALLLVLLLPLATWLLYRELGEPRALHPGATASTAAPAAMAGEQPQSLEEATAGLAERMRES